mmetsp:Transcript_28565/g.111802  ORF Transcript_28565/g.111802 Transcript_28565/m.111802 type:complete len:224 (-) Transcript_28565:430-1101(-)
MESRTSTERRIRGRACLLFVSRVIPQKVSPEIFHSAPQQTWERLLNVHHRALMEIYRRVCCASPSLVHPKRRDDQTSKSGLPILLGGRFDHTPPERTQGYSWAQRAFHRVSAEASTAYHRAFHGGFRRGFRRGFHGGFHRAIRRAIHRGYRTGFRTGFHREASTARLTQPGFRREVSTEAFAEASTEHRGFHRGLKQRGFHRGTCYPQAFSIVGSSATSGADN